MSQEGAGDDLTGMGDLRGASTDSGDDDDASSIGDFMCSDHESASPEPRQSRSVSLSQARTNVLTLPRASGTRDPSGFQIRAESFFDANPNLSRNGRAALAMRHAQELRARLQQPQAFLVPEPPAASQRRDRSAAAAARAAPAPPANDGGTSHSGSKNWVTTFYYCVIEGLQDKTLPVSEEHWQKIFPSDDGSDGLDYICVGLERCKTTGRIHGQGYCEFRERMSLKKVKALWGGNNNYWAIRRGEQDDAIEYTKKEEGGPHDDGTSIRGTWYEAGVRHPPDASGVQKMLIKEIKLGRIATERDIAIKHPRAFLACGKNATALLEHHRPQPLAHKERTVKVYCIWGAARTGKSRMARDMFGKRGKDGKFLYVKCADGDENEYIWKETGNYVEDATQPDGFRQVKPGDGDWHRDHSAIYMKNAADKWWDGYNNELHRVVNVNEMHGSRMSIQEFNDMVDRYPLGVEIKGKKTFLGYTVIVFTSNWHPRDWWKKAFEEAEAAGNYEVRTSVLERFTEIIHIGRDPLRDMMNDARAAAPPPVVPVVDAAAVAAPPPQFDLAQLKAELWAEMRRQLAVELSLQRVAPLPAISSQADLTKAIERALQEDEAE